MSKTIALFHNARQVMRAERLCHEAGIEVRVMPVPEQISSECGMCLMTEGDEARAGLDAVCAENGISVTYGEI